MKRMLIIGLTLCTIPCFAGNDKQPGDEVFNVKYEVV